MERQWGRQPVNWLAALFIQEMCVTIRPEQIERARAAFVAD